jgi:FkbM family methyltransferase
MNFAWKMLRYVPSPIMYAVKRHTSATARLRARELFGGSYRTIPDKIVTLPDGRRFHIGPDYIYWPIFMGLEFEPEATEIVRKLVRSGEMVVDAGANYGWYTTLFAELVGSTGRVYAFEPVPPTFARLREHLVLNGYEERVVATRSAVGAEQGDVQVHVFDNLSHARSSLSALDQTCYKTHFARSIDLDSFLQSCGVDQVDFIKCDVEGSELNVLQGACEILKRSDAPIILVELNDETSAAFGYRPADIWRFLASKGYDRFYAIQSKHNIRPVVAEAEVAKVNLLLCGKGDRIEKRLAERQRARVAA